MNIEKIKAGDIVVFERDNCLLHGKVTSVGCRYVVSPFLGTDEKILFIRVIEHPEWKETTLTAKEVKDVLITAEKVHFT